MDEDDVALSVAYASWFFGWLGGGAALHWAVGWSWWWAVPVPLVAAFFVALGLYGLLVFVCALFEDVDEGGPFRFWAVGWLGGAAGLHWGLGWSWWWAVPVTFFVSLALRGLIVLVCDAISPEYADDFEEEDGEPEADEESEDGSRPMPPRAGVALDARAKKLFVQLDDPATGQRGNALELLRAHLAKNNRTFRDLLHEFEGRSDG